MATTRFKTTMDAIQGGLKNLPTDKAVQNIEGWEDYLQKHEGDGTKAVLADLGKLKKLLGAKEVDSEAVNKLLEKMGKDTVKAAGKEENAESKHIRELGEVLTKATESSDDKDEDPEEDDLVDEDEDAEDALEDDEEDDDEDEDEEDDDDEDDDDEDEIVDDEEEDEVEDEPKKSAAKKAPAKKSAAKTAAKKSK